MVKPHLVRIPNGQWKCVPAYRTGNTLRRLYGSVLRDTFKYTGFGVTPFDAYESFIKINKLQAISN